MFLADRLTLDAPRRTADGYLAVRARAARTGVYQYTGREIDPQNKHGLRDQAVVNVLRDEATVFDRAAIQSFIGKPITDDHPTQPVTKDNWRQHARGTVMGALRDGEYVAFDLLLTDADTIAKVEDGKRELSNGYGAELEFGDFAAADGTRCQARQSKITGGNHVALVDRGRAGPDCRINDGAFAACDANPEAVARLMHQEKTVKKITLDGLQVDLSDADAVAAAISKLQDKATTAETALADARKDFDKQLAAKDAEIDSLKTKVVDEATIDARAAVKADVLGKAKAVLGDKAPEFAGKTVAEIRRMTVATKLGDAAVKDKSDDYVEARFDGLTADTKLQVQPLGQPIATMTNDNASVRDLARASQY
jgi:hypothetical protein